MPGSPHEAIHHVFREDTVLAFRSLRRIFAVDLPDPDKISEVNIDMTEVLPLERRCDTVLLAETAEVQHAYIIESQIDPNDAKLESWPYYIAYLHNRYHCQVSLLVWCSSTRTAEWARQTIKIGLPNLASMIVFPIVFGPDNVPIITDQRDANADPSLTVASALVHRHSPDSAGILKVLNPALATMELETAENLARLLEVGLGDTAAGQLWRTLMAAQTFDYQTELERIGEAKGETKGAIKGAIKSILAVLDTRGIAVTEQHRERITACTDVDRLDAWVRRAAIVDSADDLFD